MFWFLPGVLTKGEINEEVLISLRSCIVTSVAAGNGYQIGLLPSFEEVCRRDVVHI